MGRSQETFGKKEKEKKRLKKRDDKIKKQQERKANAKSSSFEDMLAYVDENGNITDTPPDPTKKKTVIKAENIQIGATKRDDVEEETELTGKVDFFNDQKGFGFIKTESGEKYFVHIHGVIDEIQENDKVSFELERGLKGMNAVRVKKI